MMDNLPFDQLIWETASAMLVSMRQKNIAQVLILERYFLVSTYQAASPDTCLAVFVVASLPLCL